MRLLAPEVRTFIEALIAEGGRGRAVAFDADGTLWRGDVGEELLRFLAAEDRLPRHRGRRGLYDEYERRVRVDPADAYAWSVEVMAELAAPEVQRLCDDFFRARFAGRVHPWVRGVLDALVGAGFVPWIVSASPLWPVVSGASWLDVPAGNVIAVACELEGDRLTRRVVRPVPCGEGKVHWLRARGVRPALAVGNGDLDLPMLAYAERALVVAPRDEDNDLVRHARAHGWPIQRC